MAFEESPEIFWQRFTDFAIPAEIMPVPYGYPLVEALTQIGAVYAFDRGAPPTPVGRLDVLFACSLENFRYRHSRPQLQRMPAGRTMLAGKVLRQLDDYTYLFDVGIPLIINSHEPLEVGASLEVVAAPPLMVFRNEV